MAFVSSNVFGQAAVYTGPLSGLTVANGFATNATRVASFNTGYDIFSLNSLKISGTNAVFGGTLLDDGTYGTFNGGNQPLATSETNVPGGPGKFIGIAGNGADLGRDPAALQGGNYLFRGTYNVDVNGIPQNKGLFIVPAGGNGSISKIVATGDQPPRYGGLFTDAVVGPASLENGRVALQLSIGARGLYLATPRSLSADLRVRVLPSPARQAVGATVVYNLSVTNPDPAVAREVVLKLTLPPAFTVLSATGGGTFAAPDVTFVIGNLAGGGTFTGSVTGRLNADGLITASANVTSSTPDPTTANNHAFATTGNPRPPRQPANYTFTTVVDTLTPVPGQPGNTFGLPFGADAIPALSGSKVVFLASELNGPVVWSANVAGGGLTRLGDTFTAIPRGSGNFAGFGSLRLKNGTAAFFGSNPTNSQAGFFSLPAVGGPARRVYSTSTAVPGGTGNFTYADFTQGGLVGGLADGNALFTGHGGTYSFPINGLGAGKALIYPNSFFPLANYGFGGVNLQGAADLSGTHVTLPLGEIFSNNSIWCTWLDERNPAPQASANTRVPQTVPPVNFSSFSSFGSPHAQGEAVVFTAFSTVNSVQVRGIYSVSGGVVRKIVDTNTNIPLGAGKFTTQSFNTVAFNDGEIVFSGYDANNVAGIYTVPATGGTIFKVVANGDIIQGVNRVSAIGATDSSFGFNGLDQGRVAIRVVLTDINTSVGRTAVVVAAQ